MVMEEMEQNWDDMGAAMDVGSMDGEAAPSFWGKYKFLVIAGAATAIGIAAAVVIRIRKKRKAAREEDVDDEISDLVIMSINNLRRRKLRTVLTVLGVIIGTASIVVMVSWESDWTRCFMERDFLLGKPRPPSTCIPVPPMGTR